MSDRTFDSFINSYSGPVLGEFWASTGPHCHTFAPVVRTIAERLADQAAVVQVNTQECPSLAARFAIRGIPAIVLLKHGRVIDQLQGAQSLDAVMSWFRRKASGNGTGFVPNDKNPHQQDNGGRDGPQGSFLRFKS